MTRTAPIPNGRPVSTDAAGCWSVALVDRRTGQVQRRNGAAVVVLTSDPERAAIDLLDGRDANLWQARIDPLTGTKTITSVGGRHVSRFA